MTRGVAYMVNNNRNTDAIATGIGKEAGDKFQNFFYYGKTLGVYNTFWIALVIFLIFFFLLSKTRTERKTYLRHRLNVDAAKLSGVNVVNTTIKAYLVSAACVVGYILCAQAGMGNMEAGNMYEMYGVAAGVIGGSISPLGGTGLLLGTFAGAAVWQTRERTEHDRCTGRHSETGHRYHRCILRTLRRSCPFRKLWKKATK